MKVWKRWLTLLVAVSMLVGVAVGPGAAPSSAVDLATAQVDMKVLLVTNSTTYPSYEAWTALLDREGVPYDVFNQAVDTLESADLASGDHAYYQGVVCATRCTDILGFGSASMDALEQFLGDFQLRVVHGFAPPDPIFGLSVVSDQDASGDVLTATPAGAAVFPYLDGTVVVDEFTNGFYPTIVDPASYVPFFLAPGGSPVLGVHTDPLGFDEMVMTVNSNEYQSHAILLGHGMLSWVTKGLYLGYNRNYFTAHIDDIFLPDDRWDVDDNTTYEDDGATNPLIRMVAGDVTRLLNWQSSSGIRLDMVFNGAGSVEAIADNGSDPLTDALLPVRDQLYWINHTYEHINLDPPTTQTVIEAEIQSNIDFAAANSITIDPVELVTGEHSGLGNDIYGILPNPNLGPALTAKGIDWVAADNSVQPVPYTIGSATTIPRYPANVYYNTGTWEEQLDEYNWIYTLPSGGGNCVNTSVTTCNAAELTWEQYVDAEASIMLPHLIANDPRPHYFHQSNLAEDGVFYMVFSEVLSRYNNYYEVPLVQPLFREVGEIMSRKTAWDVTKNNVTAYIQGGAVHLSSPSTVVAPLTGSPLVGDVYGGERSGWLQVGPTETILDWTAPTITLVGANPQMIVAGDSYVELGATALDNVDGVIAPASIAADASAVNTLVPGPYSVTYNVSDVAGNAAVEVVRTVNVVDGVPPNQIVDSPADGSEVLDPVTISGTASDNVGVAEVQVSIRDQVTSLYWGGSGWQADSTVVTASLSSPDGSLTGWEYEFSLGALPPSTLPYAVSVQAVDTSATQAASSAQLTFKVLDVTAPVITLVGDDPQVVEAATSYVEAGAAAIDNVDGDISGLVVADATAVDLGAVSDYQVTYNVSDAAGNPATEVTRTVRVVDTTAPTITLVGAATVEVGVGVAYVEYGATASDTLDGDVTSSIVTDASAVDTTRLGTYAVAYDVSDTVGNPAVRATRTVKVVDVTAPTITLVGANPQRISLGAAYTEFGATAMDNIDGDLTGSIVFDSSAVDRNVAGVYRATYTVTDAAGNTKQVARNVEVIDFFTDDDGSLFEREINALALLGITKGCNPPHNDEYCPERRVSRGEFAALMVRTLGLTERSDNPFVDDNDSIFEADIEKLHAAGITKGCNPPINDEYCEERTLSRGEAAAMFVRAFGYTDNGGGDLFIDDDDSVFESDIDRLATAGVTRGCNPSDGNTMFCPARLIDRGEIAAFIARALDL